MQNDTKNEATNDWLDGEPKIIFMPQEPLLPETCGPLTPGHDESLLVTPGAFSLLRSQDKKVLEEIVIELAVTLQTGIPVEKLRSGERLSAALVKPDRSVLLVLPLNSTDRFCELLKDYWLRPESAKKGDSSDELISKLRSSEYQFSLLDPNHLQTIMAKGEQRFAQEGEKLGFILVLDAQDALEGRDIQDDTTSAELSWSLQVALEGKEVSIIMFHLDPPKPDGQSLKPVAETEREEDAATV